MQLPINETTLIVLVVVFIFIFFLYLGFSGGGDLVGLRTIFGHFGG